MPNKINVHGVEQEAILTFLNIHFFMIDIITVTLIIIIKMVPLHKHVIILTQVFVASFIL